MIQPAPMPLTVPAAAPTLRRALGRWDLTAIGINQVIGGAIFLLPSPVAAQIGGGGPSGFLLMGLWSMSGPLCFPHTVTPFYGTPRPLLSPPHALLPPPAVPRSR